MIRSIPLIAALTLILAGPSTPTEPWAIQLAPGADPAAVATQTGAVSWRPVGALEGIYLLEIPTGAARLNTAPDVLWAEKQTPLVFVNRDPVDPLYPDQWHLENTGQASGTPGNDANLPPAWDRGYTGAGVTIGIVEGGAPEGTHPDLVTNYDAANSLFVSGSTSSHATAVAGVAAADDDGISCGVGAAYDAAFTALDRGSNDASTGAALSHALAAHEVYNNSWGPTDDGARLEGPLALTQAALEKGIAQGRGGLGAIYVWAGGNGRTLFDDINADGYTNSRYTIAVGATTNEGEVAFYSEPGTAMLINAPSSGGSAGITTTDRSGTVGLSSNDCTSGFSGTSASSPLVAGVVALMLEANPDLTWRDVQHILVETATTNDPANSGWVTNGAGYDVHLDYGHGRIDAGAAVTMAETWVNVPAAETLSTGALTVGEAIPDGSLTPLSASVTIPAEITLEHVEVTVNVEHPSRGELEFELISPDGTVSRLLRDRPNDTTADIEGWRMMSTFHWGEQAAGEWTLRVTDKTSGNAGTLLDWELTLHGTQRLLQNASFEDPLDGTWEPLGSVPGPFAYGRTPLGQQVLLVEGTDGTSGVQQIVPVTGSQSTEVTLTFLTGGRDTGTEGFIGARLRLLDATGAAVDAVVCLATPRQSTFGVQRVECRIPNAAAAFTAIEVGLGGLRVGQGLYGFDAVVLTVGE